MTIILFVIFTAAASFTLGYWVSSHPDDARKFREQIADSVRRLFKRGEQPK